ncbi:hypothetical protein R1L06_13630 [Stenotrophomonas sp. C4297]|nr:hypothetical protein [Stenotrophomonas sp. C4297]MDV3511769.1 hypothetical protein [Stenotrophomonas sp. C4297]
MISDSLVKHKDGAMHKSARNQSTTPSFENVWSRLERICGLEGDPLTEQMCLTPLTSVELRSVNDALALARTLHASGNPEEAWYYLWEAGSIVSYRDGFMEGRYESSDRAGATRLAAEYGRLGAKRKKAINEAKREDAVAALLAQHEADPFRIRRQLKEAAAKLGPGGGKLHTDAGWGYRLIKQTRLYDLYDSLSARRKP